MTTNQITHVFAVVLEGEYSDQSTSIYSVPIQDLELFMGLMDHYDGQVEAVFAFGMLPNIHKWGRVKSPSDRVAMYGLPDEERQPELFAYVERLLDSRPTIVSGDRVRWTRAFVERMTNGDSANHIAEFKGCVGVCEGHENSGYPKWDERPELAVRWMPSGLRYSYLPECLERAPVSAKKDSP